MIRLDVLGYPSLAAYYECDHWRKLKANFKPNKKCSACEKGGRLELHHKTYKNLGVEKAHELCFLCGDCHESIHVLALGLNLRIWESTERFIKTFHQKKKVVPKPQIKGRKKRRIQFAQKRSAKRESDYRVDPTLIRVVQRPIW